MCILLLIEPVRLTRTSSTRICRVWYSIIGEDVLLIVGDLNARVGSGKDGEMSGIQCGVDMVLVR